MISIFAKRAFLNINAGQEFEYKGQAPKRGHLLRVSSMIRADQIADQIGAKLNPTDGYQDDVCIYVKPHIPKGVMEFKFEGKKSYVDVIDGWGLLPLLTKYPEVTAIACSQQDYEILSKNIPNQVVLIPQHHCNFDREKRTRVGVKTVGVIGTEGAFPLLPKQLEEELEKRGIKLLTYSKFFTRQDIIDFYKQIDIQIVWRPYRMRLSNPLKIVNASSFGIPTIAFEESVFKEVEGCYIPVRDLEGFLNWLDKLRTDHILYSIYSDTCLQKAESYHIENVGKLYKELERRIQCEL